MYLCTMLFKRNICLLIASLVLFADSGQTVYSLTCNKSGKTCYSIKAIKSCCDNNAESKTCIENKNCCTLSFIYLKQSFVTGVYIPYKFINGKENCFIPLGIYNQFYS